MFRSVLVANRGEIACRVFRTARRMGLRCLAVHSEADANALHVREADDSRLIGPAPARESYLDAAKVLAAAEEMGAEAIHPGYGFLSENADFAEAVVAAGRVWIGPPPSAIRAMGLKDAAKSLMDAAGVPVTPGYQGEDQSAERLAAEAARIGFPVLIKAVAGGGGKGMKRVDRAEEFASALASAQREAKAAFGDDRVLLETYITRPRHIEVQVFGDADGNVVHLFERDCSLQRRHQKVIEEAPAPGMDEATRAAVTAAAIRAAEAVNYVGAGTVEFIADASDGLRADRIWFMEMNTRLQVEHPVTEAVTGQDLVEWQFRVAAGEPLTLRQDEIRLTGHAVEARLYAEDPANDFLPSVGKLTHLRIPEGERVDTGVEQGGEVTAFYDPMIAKLIVHRADRETAAGDLAAVCEGVEVWPVRTNAGFLGRCLRHPRFLQGDVDTGFIAAEGRDLAAPEPDAALDAAAVAWIAEDVLYARRPPSNDTRGPWEGLPGPAYGLRLNGAPRAFVRAEVAGRVVSAHADSAFSGDNQWRIGPPGAPLSVRRHGSYTAVGDRQFREYWLPEGEGVVLFEGGEAVPVHPARYRPASGGGVAADGALRAPMPGRIVATPASAGQRVKKGDPVVVLEAMKMEHALVAPFDGVVEALEVEVGAQTVEGAVLARVAAAD
jgi:3-methylcrotonyl-CoA carboxylase alpha subunit